MKCEYCKEKISWLKRNQWSIQVESLDQKHLKKIHYCCAVCYRIDLDIRHDLKFKINKNDKTKM